MLNGKNAGGKNVIGKKYRFHYDQKVPLFYLTTEFIKGARINSL